jgi:two-component system nitrate/nitrite response regulator NarL
VNVLVCDDHALFADSLADLLSSSGVGAVTVAYTPAGAADALARARIDVCSLDLVFGEVNVLDRFAGIRDASPETGFLLLTGALGPGVIAAGRAAGVRGFADKTQPSADIVAAFHRIAAGRTVVPAGTRKVPTPRPALSDPAQAARRLASYLTPRERQVLSALVGGIDTVDLARRMGITRATVRCHIQSLLIKMNVHSRLEAATTAVRLGLLDPVTGDWTGTSG